MSDKSNLGANSDKSSGASPERDSNKHPGTEPESEPRPRSAPEPALAPALAPALVPAPTPDQILGASEQAKKAQARDTLRKQLSTARRQLSEDQVLEYSAAICNSLLSLIQPSSNIAGYLALGNEVRVNAILRAAREQQSKTYVPIVQSEHRMVFAHIDDEMPLVKNKFGILEPIVETSDTILAEHLDSVLVPLVGFDEHCQRMGMGGGFYDRAFAANKNAATGVKKPVLIGIAYDIQQTSSVLPDWWDVPLDYIVTETQILRRTHSSI